MTNKRYLLDTNVVSELRKKRPEPRVVTWYEPLDAEATFLSTITLMELVKGIESVKKRDVPFAEILQNWLIRVREVTFRGRLLMVTPDIAEEAGRILSLRTRSEADALIAATALNHELILVTRNTADFDDTGVILLNPWEA